VQYAQRRARLDWGPIGGSIRRLPAVNTNASKIL
jgi:hypothetical protein